MPGFDAFAAKMKAEGLSDAFIASFKLSYDALVAGSTGMIPESAIKPATGLPVLEEIKKAGKKVDPSLLAKTVVLKLNGGLGTGMGLDKAKSLLEVKNGQTFLQLIARQITDLRQKHHAPVKFMLMNSFSTSDDTKEHLSKDFPALVAEPQFELMQNKAPKVDAATLAPAVCASNPSCEWCPPGHGDLYAALEGSGTLNSLLQQGYQYMFVSNSDNLGATMDLDILTHFAASGSSFVMEVCERTPADRKGGHLAVRAADGVLLLRESAQCAKEDEAAFQDISRHRYFNTNNLWLSLPRLRAALDKAGGAIRLPLIKNAKTVDPQDASSAPVFQLETAMGAAIESFDAASALVVTRERFAPVKTCNDLLMIRSDMYEATPDHRVVLAPGSSAAMVELDGKYYKMVGGFEKMCPHGVPSLAKCTSLTVKGPVEFAAGVVIVGKVDIKNDSKEVKTVKAGTYTNQEVVL